MPVNRQRGIMMWGWHASQVDGEREAVTMMRATPTAMPARSEDPITSAAARSNSCVFEGKRGGGDMQTMRAYMQPVRWHRCVCVCVLCVCVCVCVCACVCVLCVSQHQTAPSLNSRVLLFACQRGRTGGRRLHTRPSDQRGRRAAMPHVGTHRLLPAAPADGVCE